MHTKLTLRLFGSILKSLPSRDDADRRAIAHGLFANHRAYEIAFDRRQTGDHDAQVAFALMKFDAAPRIAPEHATNLMAAVMNALEKRGRHAFPASQVLSVN